MRGPLWILGWIAGVMVGIGAYAVIGFSTGFGGDVPFIAIVVLVVAIVWLAVMGVLMARWGRGDDWPD